MREKFTIAEASCLIAGVDIRQSGLTGEASAIMHSFVDLAIKGAVHVSGGRVDAQIASYLRGAPGGFGDVADDAALGAEWNVDKATIAVVANTLGRAIPY